MVGLQSEVAVDQTGVEPEILKAGLERRDVVAVHRGTELVHQRAGTEAVGRLSQRPGRGLSDDAVDQETAVLLKGTNRAVEVVVEQVGHDVSSSGEVVVGALQ
ncbi:hypothetical protein MDOR_38260 [Mycolicibacterium doricum]|uniref:Uncharacterized protein n=1 Tax=Mycolicibacterium doricum TaxID=126673 RepID=A0A7I7VY23_9MYCO|nr:hypothetical protein MDOR_38260 [Mycolicibacterium doricum]